MLSNAFFMFFVDPPSDQVDARSTMRTAQFILRRLFTRVYCLTSSCFLVFDLRDADFFAFSLAACSSGRSSAGILPAGKVRFINANDGTCEGIDYPDLRAFTVQFHPEACTGPKDTAFLFDQFVDLMKGGDQ